MAVAHQRATVSVAARRRGVDAATVATERLPVAISATSTCPTGATPLYSYFVIGPGGGGWTLEAAWIGNSWSWSTAGSADGVYQVLVWVSDGLYTIPQAHGSATISVFTQRPCTSASAQVSSDTATAGQPAIVSAVRTCPADTQPLDSYVTGASPTGPWSLQAAWIGPDWTWNTVGVGPARTRFWFGPATASADAGSRRGNRVGDLLHPA